MDIIFSSWGAFIFFVIWIPSAIATIIISSKRGGGEGCSSLVTGILFGPFALIAALLFKDKKK